MREEKLRYEERGRETPPFVPLPTAVVDEWTPLLTGSQLKLLLVVARQTLGYADPHTGGRKPEDWLTHRQLMAKTGCASAAVSGAVDALVGAGLVRVRASGGEEVDTPQRRRRASSRLLYRLGPALIPGQGAALVPEGEPAASLIPPMTSEIEQRTETLESGQQPMTSQSKDPLTVFSPPQAPLL